MARPNKKHHKIPSTYLSGFTDNTGQLWIADRKLKLYSQKPKSILTENDYYTVRFKNGGGTLNIETKYLGGIEGSYASIYKEKLSNHKPISRIEKAKLAVFVASMLQRQPAIRKSMEKFFQDVTEMIKHMEEVPIEQRRKYASIMPPSSGKGIPASDLIEAGKDIGSLHSGSIPKGVTNIAPIIFGMHWAFVVKPENSNPFLTSDNPCVMANPIAEMKWGLGSFGASPGLAQSDIELTLPLSSNLVLMCGWQYKGDCDYLIIPEEYVDEINRRTTRYAEVIISSSQSMLEAIIERLRKRNKSKTK